MRPLLLHLCVLCLVIPLVCCTAFSQVDYSTGTLRGTVTDPQGAVVPGATVTVTSTAEKTRVAKTGNNGQYQVPDLPPGIYQLSIEAEGFKPKVGKDIKLTGGQTVSYDASLSALGPNPAAEAQQQQLQVITPEIVPQGEVFTIRVVEDKDTGEFPVQPGTEVVVNGKVVEAQEGGKVRVTALAEQVGDQFLWVAIRKSAEGLGTGTTTAASPQHVEVVRLPQPPAQLHSSLWHVSELSPSGGDIRVDGQGLGGLQNASLQAGATSYPLSDSVGSSLQQIYRCPKDLPKGRYRFVAQDASGQRVEAPNATTNPTLTITGTQIRRRGQRGKFVVSSDVEGDVLLSGGEPIIQLDARAVHVSPNKPATVGFTAVQVGQYDLHALLQSPESTPATAPRAQANVGKLETQFNPSENKTSVSAPVRVTGEGGQPISSSGVDVALVGPQGIQYARLTTDTSGNARFQASLTGDVGNSLALYSFRVLGHHLGQPPPKGPDKKH